MSQINVDNIRNRTGGAINAPAGIVVTGVSTFTGQLFGNNSSFTGVSTFNSIKVSNLEIDDLVVGIATIQERFEKMKMLSDKQKHTLGTLNKNLTDMKLKKS